jgi:hypothetical protein
MIMGALGNVLGDHIVRRHFSGGEIRRVVKPLIAMERFDAGLIR